MRSPQPLPADSETAHEYDTNLDCDQTKGTLETQDPITLVMQLVEVPRVYWTLVYKVPRLVEDSMSGVGH